MFGKKKVQDGAAARDDNEKGIALGSEARAATGENIVRLPAAVYYGRRRHIDTKKADNGEQVRAFWQECREDGTLDALKAMADPGAPRFTAACTNFQTRSYDYWIAVEPVPGAPLPEGYERLEVGAGQCAVFPCEGPAREAVEEKWHFIYNKWFPKAKYGYDSALGAELENYPFGDMEAADYRCEILVPIKEIKQTAPPRRRDSMLGFLCVAIGAVVGMLLAGSSDNALLFILIGGAAGYFVYAYASKRYDEIKKKREEEGEEDRPE